MEELTRQLEAYVAALHNKEDGGDVKESGASLAQELDRFFAEHNDASEAKPTPCEFAAKYGRPARSGCFSALLSLLRFTKSELVPHQVRVAALRVVRLFTRETQHPEDIAQPEVLDLLWTRHANLDGHAGVEVGAEGCRCLVNLLQQSSKELLPHLHTKGVQPLIRTLEREQDTAYRIALLRLLFNCSLDQKSSPHFQSLEQEGALPLAIHVLGQALEQLEVDPLQEELAADALRVILSLTMHLGPLSNPPNPLPEPHEREAWKRLVPHIHTIMEFQDGAHYRLQRYAVAVLVNTPQGCADYFRIDLQSINSLLAFLRRQLKEPDEKQVTPVLIVLLAIAKGVPVLRRHMIASCFPAQPPPNISSKPINPPENWEENEIGGQLIKLMTSVDIGLKHFVNEFIFVLCEEDVDAFVQLTGFGNAAGWLATRNLFSGFQKLGSASPPDRQPAVRQEGGDEAGDQNEEPEEAEVEYSEKDEKSLNDLIVTIQRLQQLGVVDVLQVKKKEKD